MDTYRSVTHDIYSTHVSRSGRPDNKAYKFDPDAGSQIGAFWHLWPTMTFNVAPGESNFALYYLLPLGPERTLTVTDYYFAGTGMTEKRQARLDYADRKSVVKGKSVVVRVDLGGRRIIKKKKEYQKKKKYRK